MSTEGNYRIERVSLRNPETEVFSIKDASSMERWQTHIWPQIDTLFATTWPEKPDEDRREEYTRILQQPDAAVVLMTDSTTGQIIGTSFIYQLQPTYYSQRWIGEKRAYNRSVIIDPRERQHGLVIPLLEQTLSAASALGYDSMEGIYNANIGQMSDGHRVISGFANKIISHPWQNGRVIEHYHYPPGDANNNDNMQELIVFDLKRPMAILSMPMRRLPLQPTQHAMVA